MTSKFMKTTWRLLQERLDLVLKKEVPEETEKREFFYTCRTAYQKEWNVIVIDYGGANKPKPENPYGSWATAVIEWSLKQCRILGIREGRFWEVAKKLNITIHNRGSCIRDSPDRGKEEILVNYESRQKVMSDCSFILISEKDSKTHLIWEALRDEGYVLNLLSVGGHSTGNVQSIVAQVGDMLQELDTPNFYILSLHDYDIDGITMVHTLRKWYDNVLDVGLHKKFFEFNKIDLDKKLYEGVVIKKDPKLLLKWVKNQPEYDTRELKGLIGKNTSKTKRWSSVGKRIELDTVYSKHGIKPMVDYIVHVLENDTEEWDLTKIGVEEQELEEPEDYYEKSTHRKILKVNKEYRKKTHELSKTSSRMKEIIGETCFLPEEYAELKEKYLGENLDPEHVWHFDLDNGKRAQYRKFDIKGLESLKIKYILERNKEWVDDYQPTVDEEINDKLECWDESVAHIKQFIEDRVGELQGELNDAKADDPELVKYKEELDKVDWGKDELDAIIPEDPVQRVRRVINAFEEYINELESETHRSET